MGPPGACPGVGSALYAVIGDLARDGRLANFPDGDPPDDTAAVFRVCQDGSAAPGNPFTPYCGLTTSTTCTGDADCPGGESCTSEVARYWAYGIRNSFGLALDP